MPKQFCAEICIQHVKSISKSADKKKLSCQKISNPAKCSYLAVIFHFPSQKVLVKKILDQRLIYTDFDYSIVDGDSKSRLKNVAK